MADEFPALAEFLRSRRQRVMPEDVGLPNTGRRRTPGLRREELALLAGISVDYLTRMEQGRETKPSQAVLASLADALQLSRQEAHHLGMLVMKPQLERRLCPSSPDPYELDETTLQLLDRMAPSPAFVMYVTTEVLAWNDPYERLMQATGLFDHEPPNLLKYTFLSPQSKAVYADWDGMAREQVGNLRAATAESCEAQQALTELVGELSVKSSEFATLWADHEVAAKAWGTKSIVHPDAGELNLRFQALLLPDGSYRRLVVYLPADEATRSRLDDLVTPELGTTPLRVVSSQ